MNYAEQIREQAERRKQADALRLRMDDLIDGMLDDGLTAEKLMTLRREHDALSVRLARLTGNLCDIDVCLTIENYRYQTLF
jgi:hypothetical protein